MRGEKREGKRGEGEGAKWFCCVGAIWPVPMNRYCTYFI